MAETHTVELLPKPAPGPVSAANTRCGSADLDQLDIFRAFAGKGDKHLVAPVLTDDGSLHRLHYAGSEDVRCEYSAGCWRWVVVTDSDSKRLVRVGDQVQTVIDALTATGSLSAKDAWHRDAARAIRERRDLIDRVVEMQTERDEARAHSERCRHLPGSSVRVLSAIASRLAGGEDAASVAADYTREGDPLTADDLGWLAELIQTPPLVLGELEQLRRELRRAEIHVSIARAKVEEMEDARRRWARIEVGDIDADARRVCLEVQEDAARTLAACLLGAIGDASNYVEQVLDVGGSDSASLTFPGVSVVVTTMRDDAKSPHQLRMEAEAERDQARAELAVLRALLDTPTGALAAGTEFDADEPSEGYGAFPGGDPRTFTPDTEACTTEEIQAHAEACRLADEREAKGELVAIAGSHYWTMVGGRSCHVAYEPFGVGTYLITHDEEQE